MTNVESRAWDSQQTGYSQQAEELTGIRKPSRTPDGRVIEYDKNGVAWTFDANSMAWTQVMPPSSLYDAQKRRISPPRVTYDRGVDINSRSLLI